MLAGNIQNEWTTVGKIKWKGNLPLKIICSKYITKNSFFNVAIHRIVCKFKNILAPFLSGRFNLAFSKAILLTASSLVCGFVWQVNEQLCNFFINFWTLLSKMGIPSRNQWIHYSFVTSSHVILYNKYLLMQNFSKHAWKHVVTSYFCCVNNMLFHCVKCSCIILEIKASLPFWVNEISSYLRIQSIWS